MNYNKNSKFQVLVKCPKCKNWKLMPLKINVFTGHHSWKQGTVIDDSSLMETISIPMYLERYFAYHPHNDIIYWSLHWKTTLMKDHGFRNHVNLSLAIFFMSLYLYWETMHLDQKTTMGPVLGVVSQKRDYCIPDQYLYLAFIASAKKVFYMTDLSFKMGKKACSVPQKIEC